MNLQHLCSLGMFSRPTNRTGRLWLILIPLLRKELVGKGAYGGVYKGIHNATGLVVALKVIDLDTPDDDISEIQKEVALLSEMRDANKYNITLYHGCYLNGHELWIAMDFASGGSIRTLVRTRRSLAGYLMTGMLICVLFWMFTVCR